MSLYEVLERFTGAGVLACAGLAGVDMPAGRPFDGAAFAARLRGGTLNEAFGATLDILAHAVWFARERHGIPVDTAERHAGALTLLLGEVRLAPADLATITSAARPAAPGGRPDPASATMGARVAALWLERASAAGVIAKAGLDIEICRFLIAEMMALVVDTPQLLTVLAPALAEHRAALDRQEEPSGAGGTAPAPPVGGGTVASSPVQASAPPPPTPPPTPPPAVPPATAAPVAGVPAMASARDQLSPGALRRFQSILAQQPMSAVQRQARLEELGGWLVATVAHLRKPGNEAAELRQAKLAAAAALEAGELELAMERLKLVRDHMREGRRRAEARIAEELQALRQQMVEEAAATARLGELALARMDLDTAADHFADAAGQLPARESALELEYRQRQAEALAAKAETTGDVRAIEAAAQAYRACRRLLLVDTDARLRVRIGVGLGDMLAGLAARRGGDDSALDEAIAAYEEALAAIDRAAKPMQWALVQLSHAAALIELGQRRDREHNWRSAAARLMPALEVFESRGAADLAEAARAKLRTIAGALDLQQAPALLARPPRTAAS